MRDGLDVIDRMSKSFKLAVEEYNVGIISLLWSNTVDGFLDGFVDIKHLHGKYTFRITHLWEKGSQST